MTIHSYGTEDEYFLVDVIAHILKHLKDTLIEKLRKQVMYHQYAASDFDWVVTVPAIWKPRGKQMMREASYKVFQLLVLLSSSL